MTGITKTAGNDLLVSPRLFARWGGCLRPADLSTPSRLLTDPHSSNSKYCQQRVLTFPPRNTHGPWPLLFGFCSLKMTSNVPFKITSSGPVVQVTTAPPQCHPQEGACLGRMFTQWLVNSFTTNTNNSNAKFGGFGKGNWVTGASCLWSLPSPLHLINWRAGVNLMKQEDAGLRTQTLRNPSHKNLW